MPALLPSLRRCRPPPVPEPTVEPILIAHIDTLTPEGIGAFIERYREEFGDMFVDDASFHGDYSLVSRAVPDTPALTESISFRDGFKREATSIPRRTGQPTFDLGSIQIDKLAPYMVNIGGYINVPDAAITHLIVDVNYGLPKIRIYGDNGLGHQGRIEVTPWGEISRVYRTRTRVGGERVMTSNSSRTRARDVDRSDTCAVLDAALSDGQITVEEHATRTASAMTATTLGQLDLLVHDLQKATLRNAVAKVRRIDKTGTSRPHRLHSQPDRVSHLVRRRFTPTVSTGGSQGAEPLAPIVSSTLNTVTASGIREFITRYNNKYGTTVIDSASFYDGHASVSRAAAISPNVEEDIDFRGGFTPRDSTSTRAASTVTFDLAAVDIDKLAGYLAGASANLNVPDAEITHISMSSSGQEPRISIYASNDLGASGSMDLTPDGRPIRLSPFTPR